MELAKKVRVAPSYISQIERGDTMAELYAKRIAKVLGLDFDELFEESPDRRGRYRAKSVKITVKK